MNNKVLWYSTGNCIEYPEIKTIASVFSCVWLFVTPWTVACKAPLSMEFFRQEHWSWVAISFSRGSLDPGIEPASQARQADSLPWGHQGSPRRPRETSSSPGWSSPPSGHRVSLCRCWQPCLDRLHTSSRKSSGKGHKARDLSEQPFLTRITNGHTQTSGQQSALFKGVCRVTGVFKRVTEEKGTKEDEMVGWHHWLNGHGFGDGQGSLACCSPRGHKELDTTERLNWTELNWTKHASLYTLFST